VELDISRWQGANSMVVDDLKGQLAQKGLCCEVLLSKTHRFIDREYAVLKRSLLDIDAERDRLQSELDEMVVRAVYFHYIKMCRTRN
jgi:hypothetical protein